MFKKMGRRGFSKRGSPDVRVVRGGEGLKTLGNFKC